MNAPRDLQQVYDVFDDLTLHITQDKFYIEPIGYKQLLCIDRISEEAKFVPKPDHIPCERRQDFCGLLGSIQLISGKYLLIATTRELVGFLNGHAIWKLVDTKLIPYAKSTIHMNAQQIADNDQYIRMIHLVLSTPYFYFSYSYDLTHSLQRLHSAGPGFNSQSMFARADQRFVWNRYLLKNFMSYDYKNFALPLIHGFISINQCVVNGNNFIWAIISRRSIHRAGTRLFRRGIDRDGSVANFVETEQIVEYDNDKCSFVQIRGSIPLFWSQSPDLRYKPPPKVLDVDSEEQKQACVKHLDSMSLLYGRQVLLDLVDQKGAEGRLEQAFSDVIASIGYTSVRYEPFDFHAECRHMKWERLSILIDRVAHDQDEMGYFLLLRDGSLISLQDGVFRTNCIDCLDRTNVVQSMLARRALTNMLRRLNVLKPDEVTEQMHGLEMLFKNVWADNADLISIQYSGTGALKTDFTRTGKRTKAGLCRDGINSMTRYIRNNFKDGFRQDAIDLFLGLSDLRSPLGIERDWKYATFPSVLLVAVAMFVTCAVLPSEYSTESLLFLLFWGVMVGATAHTIFRHGTEFVDKPQLTN